MRAKDDIDFSTIVWETVDEKKAEFIYREAMEHHKTMIENNNRINDKALGLLSFTMPVMAALSGFFAVTWGDVSPPLFAAAVNSGVFLFAITILLLVLIVPRGVFQGAGSPAAYFTGDYYQGDMRALYIGNIMTLHSSTLHDRKIMYKRADLFSAAVVLCAASPVVSLLVFFVVR